MLYVKMIDGKRNYAYLINRNAFELKIITTLVSKKDKSTASLFKNVNHLSGSYSCSIL